MVKTNELFQILHTNMNDLCFLIPVKLDDPNQSRFIIRCIGSIRRIYTNVKIIVAVARNSLPLNEQFDENVIQVTNPFFSTIGCISLFHTHKYAKTALILHDSVVLLAPVPPLQTGIQFVYYFNEPTLDRPRNDEGYRRLLPIHDWLTMINTHSFGCFGNMIYIHEDSLEKSGILPFIPLIKTKYDFECMERIIAYITKKNNVLQNTVLCGDVFHPIVDPWVHPEYASKTVDEFIHDKFPFIIAKCIVARK